MKKYSYLILVLILISCQKEEKNNLKPVISTEKTDSISNSQIDFVKDSTNIDDSLSITKDSTNKFEENILEKSNTNSKYKVESISELWNRYKTSKALAEKFVAKSNLDSIIYYLNRAADASYELSREDIATWQLNNIGYHSISIFKKNTDYELRMQKLVTLKNLKDKALYIEETKKLFDKNFHILTNAEIYLYKAQLLDSELEPSDRTKIIESNLEFIDWIANYISKGSRESRIKNNE